NECLSSPCHINANCTDNESSFDCQCNVGFSGNGFNCSNINECLTSLCHPNASCADTEGSFVCQCNSGYSGNGLNCSNIDECLSKPCHVNASCTDNGGSYDCQCNPGFSGDGISNCANINECLNVSCHVNADCLDTPGSYICRCKTGFKGNGTFCESDLSEQGVMDLTMVIGIPAITLILLLVIAGLVYLYCHRIKKRCCGPRLIPTQHGEHDVILEMEATRSLNENQPLSQQPTATATDDLQYNGAGTTPALNKDNDGSLSSLL
ncbi:kinase C-binding NELL1-like, partial, partial [Paramuricea clavata]